MHHNYASDHYAEFIK